MKCKPATYTLIRLHAEIAGKLKASKQEGATIRANLKHVGAVIQLLEPGFDLRSIIPKKPHPINRWFARGECLQRALNVLRVSDKPLTSRQIAILVLQDRGVSDATESLIKKTTRAVYASLLYRRGKSVSIHNDTMPTRWSLPT
jgi:hypothetical protein